MNHDNPKVKILGIVATPIRDGNCNWLMQKATEICKAYGDNVEVEVINIYDYEIKQCTGCEACVKHIFRKHAEVGDIHPLPVREYNCSIKDDMVGLHQKMLEADGIMFSVPTYIATIPGPLKTFFDRCRTFVHDHRLTGKTGLSMTSVFYRHCGGESLGMFMSLTMTAIGLTPAAYGAISLSTKDGTGGKVAETRYAVSQDTNGMSSLKRGVNNFIKQVLTRKAGLVAFSPEKLEEFKHNKW